MYNRREIAENIYYVGVNDRQKHLFENYIPIPYGVSYNSYLIVDEKVALIDTVDVSMSGIFFNKIESLLQNRTIDYLVINHMEPDHSGSIGLLCQRYPHLTLVGNAKTFEMLNGYFDCKVKTLVVKEGENLSLGKRQLTFYCAPMVHWPEVMVAYESKDKILFSADAFGTFGTIDGDFLDQNINTNKYWEEMRRYYACIVGKFGKAVQAALTKLSGLEIKTICSTHGPVWRKEIEKTIALYDQMSKYETQEGVVVAYGSMYGNTELLAEAFAEGVIAGGVKDVVLHNVSKTDASYILADIFKYKGLAIGSPTYMNQVYPLVESLLQKIHHRGVPNRVYACFSGQTWAGGASTILNTFGETMNWEVIDKSLENHQGVKNAKYREAFELGQKMAQKLVFQR